MDAWGWLYGTPAHDSVELIMSEPAANAMTQGRVPGRDAELRLSREDGGRGLLRVTALAWERGTAPRPGPPARPSGRWYPPCRSTGEPGKHPVPSVVVAGFDDHDFLFGGPVDEAVLVVDPA